jgi:hypothetical protein
VLLLALTAALLGADPGPQLKSLRGLNVAALKPWLIANLPSLAKCGKPGAGTESDEVSVTAQFSSGPDVRVERVEAALSDVACVKSAVEAWKNDGKQPRAGPFSFVYRFRPR